MSLMVITSKKIILIHIPETQSPLTCKFIQIGLKKKDLGAVHFSRSIYPLHKPVSYFLQDFSNNDTKFGKYMNSLNITQDYFKICCVKNPWERAVCAWTNTHRKRMSEIGINESFEYFLELAYMDKQDIKKEIFPEKSRQIKEYIDHTFKPCYYYTEGNIDFIIREERFKEDYSSLCENIDIKNKMIEGILGKKTEHRSAYNHRTRQIVSEMFDDDIQAFGYEF